MKLRRRVVILGRQVKQLVTIAKKHGAQCRIPARRRVSSCLVCEARGACLFTSVRGQCWVGSLISVRAALVLWYDLPRAPGAPGLQTMSPSCCESRRRLRAPPQVCLCASGLSGLFDGERRIISHRSDRGQFGV